MVKGADTVADYQFTIAYPWVRKVLPQDGRKFLDNRTLETMDELLYLSKIGDLFQVASKMSIMSKPRYKSTPIRLSPSGCYICGKPGHHAAECKLRAGGSGGPV